MKQPPSSNNLEEFWAYLDGSLSEKEVLDIETNLESSASLRDELNRCSQLQESLHSYQQQPVPQWNPETIFRGPTRPNTNNWLPMAIAATALFISLLPYIHINDSNISFGKNSNYVSAKQLQQSLEDFNRQQNLVVSLNMEQLKTEQNAKTQEVILALLSYTEKRRRNDLTQMASWFSRQSELNQNQQRQIINWVVNEQQQDQQAITSLFNSINDETIPVSNEVIP